MSVFGVSEPVIIAGIVCVIVFIKYGLPILIKKKTTIDYNNFDFKNTVAFHHFGGTFGPGYSNLQLKEAPTVHGDSKATMWLEGLPRPFTDLNINPLSKKYNFKIKNTADAIFGTRIDVYWNVDANGNKTQWDNVLVQNWNIYSDELQKSAKEKVLINSLMEKEFTNEVTKKMKNKSEKEYINTLISNNKNIEKRFDYYVFSIDPKLTNDIDDAMSIKDNIISVYKLIL